MRNSSDNEVISVYEFNPEVAKRTLQIIEFQKADRDWLHFVLSNRQGNNWAELYDIVIGPVADDSVYSTLRLFETGLLDIDETIRRLRTEKLCDQILFHTDKALEYCQFIEARTCGGNQSAG